MLHRLFGSLTIPAAAQRELSHPSAPPPVRAWVQSPPAWLRVLDSLGNDDPALSHLDPGERAVIALGSTLKADLILIDERRGYAAAVDKGFEVTGTLGILDLAAKRGLIDLPEAIERLKRTNFRCRQEVIESLLVHHRHR